MQDGIQAPIKVLHLQTWDWTRACLEFGFPVFFLAPCLLSTSPSKAPWTAHFRCCSLPFHPGQVRTRPSSTRSREDRLVPYKGHVSCLRIQASNDPGYQWWPRGTGGRDWLRARPPLRKRPIVTRQNKKSARTNCADLSPRKLESRSQPSLPPNREQLDAAAIWTERRNKWIKRFYLTAMILPRICGP